MIASGQGNQKTPHESPTSASAASTPTTSSATVRLRSSRVTGASPRLLVGHEQPAGAVQDQAGAAEEGEHDEGDPQDERVDVEVAGEAAGDAGDLAVGGGAAEPAEVADLVAGDAGALRRPTGRSGASGGVVVMAQACCLGELRHHRGRP